jgi:hypothetical protein
MTHDNENLYLCLLDNLCIDKDVTLNEFSVHMHNAVELASLLRGTDDCNISKEYGHISIKNVRKVLGEHFLIFIIYALLMPENRVGNLLLR